MAYVRVSSGKQVPTGGSYHCITCTLVGNGRVSTVFQNQLGSFFLKMNFDGLSNLSLVWLTSAAKTVLLVAL